MPYNKYFDNENLILDYYIILIEASKEYREHLDIMKLQQSMSRKGNCCDNTPTDRFFRSLKHVQITKDKTKESCFSYHYKSLG